MTSESAFGGDPASITSSLDEIARNARETHQRFAEVRERVQTVVATDRSPDGAVQVTVQSSGALTDVVFGDKVRELNPSRLAAQVLACAQRAQARLADQVQSIVDDVVPDDETGGRIVAGFRDRFPEPPAVNEDEPAPRSVPQTPSQPSARRAAEDDGDDWGDGSLLVDNSR